MKVAERLIETEGGLQGERVAMSIDTSALQHIMSVLTDLYSDPELAIVREYSTNALDSHIEAGQSRPIEVSTPTDLMPFLRIRDYGVGLDAEGIRSIYSQYGTSTKRDSDDVVGMLGLGCKSALTYCDQFTLVGYKDGVMTTVAVGRDADGSGSMTIVDVTEGDFENGLEVVIPAKRDNDLADKARDFFAWWKPGTVLLDGAEPAQAEVKWIVEGRIGVTAAAREHRVIMGNVPYPLTSEQAEGIVQLPRDRYAVFFVGIGEVNFTPSREALQATKRTRETLDALKNELATVYHASLAQSIADAPTHYDALGEWLDAHSLGLPAAKALWRGKPITTQLDRTPRDQANRALYANPDDSAKSFLVGGTSTGYQADSRRKSGARAWTVAIRRSNQRYDHNEGRYISSDVPTVWFDGFDGKTITDVKRAKIEKFRPSGVYERWVFVDKLTRAEREALDGCTIVKWADVEAVKLGDGTRKRKALVGSYTVNAPGDNYAREHTADELPPDKTVWLYGNRFAADSVRRRDDVPADFWIVALPANRQAKFVRDFPAVKSVNEYLRSEADKAWAALSKTDRLAGALSDNRNVPAWVARTSLTTTDQNVADLRALLKHPNAGKALAAMNKHIQATGTRPAEYKEVADKIDAITRKYPLIGGSARYGTSLPKDAHVQLYIDAVDAAERGI